MATKDRADKRWAPRFVVEGMQGRMPLATWVDLVNLSLGGVALRSNRRLELGARYTLRLELRERELDLVGIVVWSALTGTRRDGNSSQPVYSAGLRFEETLGDPVAGLLDFIGKNKVNDERRLAGVRFRIDTGAELSGVEHYRVKLLSLTGMLIEAAGPLRGDIEHRMEIVTPDADVVQLQGRVAFQRATSGADGPGQEAGIEFVELSADNRKRLVRFLATLDRHE